MLETMQHDVELADATSVVCGAWTRGWTLPPKQSLSEWADSNRIIAKGSGAEPGRWRTSRNPPLREIMDSLSDHSPIRLVDFMKCAQIGATEVLINWAGYIIDRGSDSMIVAQPVKDLARSWAVSKFDPAVMEMPELLAKMHSDNTLEKRFPGGTLWVIWSNSSKQLRQRTARYVGMDEVDEYPRDVGGQGPADQQLEARAMSYGDRAKIYRACTPTVAGASAIEASHADGDMRVYVIQCPHCAAEQTLEIERLQPNGTFACAQNGCVIEEHHKDLMFAEVGHGGTAYWKPTNPNADPFHRSYQLWAAYAPLGLGLSWVDIAARHAAAQKDASKMPGFRNLILGVTFDGDRDEQNADEVATLAEPGVNLGTVPLGGLILTIGVDFQHDRAEAQVIATGRGQRRWVVDYAVIDIDPTRLETFDALTTYLSGTWKNTHGIDMPVSAVALDGGNWTETVAQYVKKLVGQSNAARMVETKRGYHKQTVYLIRGRNERKSERAVYRPSKTEVNQREKTLARSVGVWGVGTSVLKHLIYGWLRAGLMARDQAAADGEAEDLTARMLRFPGGRGDDKPDPLSPDPLAMPDGYYASLTVEYFDKETGYWIKPKGKRNEALDTAVYAIWASLAPAVKADAFREAQWTQLEVLYQPDVPDLFDVDSRETSQPLPPARRADSRETREASKRGGLGGNDWSIS